MSDYRVTDWGLKVDGTTNDGPALQALINLVLTQSQICPHSRIIFPRGTCILQTPVIIGQLSGSTWNFVGSIELCGEVNAYEDVAGASIIKVNDANQPAFLLQWVRGVTIRDLTFLGMNNISTSLTFNDLLTDATFIGSNSPRQDANSPHAAIVIDHFEAANTAHRYPGQPAGNYVGVSSGSTNVHIIGCQFRFWVACVVNNPATSLQQGDGVECVNCNFEYSYIGFASGQSQSRDNHLYNCEGVWLWNYVSTTKYGKQTGAAPHIHGGQAGSVKHLFDINLAYGHFACENFYGEVLIDLGWFASFVNGNNFPASFFGCYFNFGDYSNGTTTRRIDFNGSLIGPVTFESCTFTTYDSVLVFLTSAFAPGIGQPVKFSNCWVGVRGASGAGGTVSCFNNFFVNNWRHVQFEAGTIFDTSLYGASLNISNTGSGQKAGALSDLNRNYATPGQFMQVASTLYLVKNEQPIGILTASAISFSGSSGTGTFTVANAAQAGLLKIGDMIRCEGYVENVFEKAPGASSAQRYYNVFVGQISGIAGLVFTLNRVPQSLNGSPSTITGLSKTWLPRFHEPTTGNTTNGSATISSVNNTTGWSAGDEIRGNGIVDGTSLTAKTLTTITLSTTATATATGVRLFDADTGSIPTNPI